MSPLKDRVYSQLKLHVKLQAAGPGERFAVLGSHEALGCWNPNSGLQLEWNGNAWETPDPVAISPCEHVEFKFVRIRFGGIEWETGPNRVTEFPDFQGNLCLQGVFNGESVIQPSDDEVLRSTSTSNLQDEMWKSRYEEALSVLMALQKDITTRQEEQDRRSARHHQVVHDLRQQITVAQEEAAQVAERSLKEGLEKDLHLQSNLAPDIAAIPSPSFASSASCVSTPSRSVGQSSTSSLRRNPGLHFKSQRVDFRAKASQGAKVSGVAPAPPRGPIGRLSSVLEGMHKEPAGRSPGRSNSKSETALAAIRAARGASPVSPPSEDETVNQSAAPSGQQSVSREMWSRSESGFRGPTRKYERVSSQAGEAATPAAEDGINRVIASKEVLAALASAKARYDEAGSRENSR